MSLQAQGIAGCGLWYIRNNPWHAERMKGPRGKLAMMFVGMGVVIGTVFGLLVRGIAWGLARIQEV